QSPSLDRERRPGRPRRASEHEARARERGGERERLQKPPASEAPLARRTEAAARPRAPARTLHALAAVTTKTRPVHRDDTFPSRTRAGGASVP
ncbi:MAG: hypothetical protein ABR607_17085, partial [Pyrinomonadaceae bacterium]